MIVLRAGYSFTGDGGIAIPAKAGEVGWRRSAALGEAASAVLAGHRFTHGETKAFVKQGGEVASVR